MRGVLRASIRLARPGDLTAIARIHVASVRGLCRTHYAPGQLERWVRQGPRLYEWMLRSSTVFVAERGGVVVGFAAVALARREVRAVYVHPRVAGLGVGPRLLQRCERTARAFGIRVLRLSAALNAVRFYERFGWARSAAGRSPHGLPCIHMRKLLRPRV